MTVTRTITLHEKTSHTLITSAIKLQAVTSHTTVTWIITLHAVTSHTIVSNFQKPMAGGIIFYYWSNILYKRDTYVMCSINALEV